MLTLVELIRQLMERQALRRMGQLAPDQVEALGSALMRLEEAMTELRARYDLTPGDLVAVAATGAYCRSMASNYNHVPRPPVVAVRDGAARVLLRRETPEDLLSLDQG